MQITIYVDETMVASIAENAVRATFFTGDRWEGEGVGALTIRKQANQWAESQDYTAIIAEVAQAAMREAVKQAVVDAIRSDVKRTVKAMKETGELATLFDGADLS